LIDQAFDASPAIRQAIRTDLQAVRDRDPASRGFACAIPVFQGFHALQAYRVANWFWTQQRQLLAVHLQNRISEVFGVDIHPAARSARACWSTMPPVSSSAKRRH